jgi:hypothetical protein
VVDGSKSGPNPYWAVVAAHIVCYYVGAGEGPAIPDQGAPMNDYEMLAERLQAAIDSAESAYYSASDPEDETTIDEALDLLKTAKARAEAKA